MFIKAGLSFGTGLRSEGLSKPSCASKTGVVTFVFERSIFSPISGRLPAYPFP